MTTLVMPVMAPLAQMTGITAQTAVIAFQCAAGFSDIVIPTTSTTNACIGAGNIGFTQWFKLSIKLALLEWGAAPQMVTHPWSSAPFYYSVDRNACIRIGFTYASSTNPITIAAAANRKEIGEEYQQSREYFP